MLQALLDNSMDAILLTAPDGHIFKANPAACRMFQRAEEELCRLGRQAVVDATDPRLAAALAARTQASSARCELTFVRADGTRFPGEVTSAVFLDPDGEQRTSMIIRDVTEHKRVEEALRESEARYRAVVEDQTEVICRFTAEGTLTFVNEVYCRFFGKTHQELVGTTWHPRAASQDLPRIRKQLRALSAANPIVVVENRVHAGSGQVRWMQFVNRGFFDAAGRLTEIQAVGRDITERKQAEEALQESDRRLREQYAELEALYRTMPVGMCLIDRELRFLRVNERLAAIDGHPAEAHLGRTIYEVLPELAPTLEGIYRRVLDTGEPVLDIQIHGTTPATPHQPRDWLASYHPLRASDGTVRGVCGVVMDITKLKQAKEALRASREEFRALAARLQTVREEERTHIAREIHDVLAQELTCLKMDLVSLKGRLGRPLKPAGRKRLQQRLEEMTGAADRAIGSVQQIATELRPVVLDSLGLSAAIEWVAKDFAARSGIACEVSAPEGPQRLERERATALFRIVQESLTNVLRHAGATQVRICLQWQPSHVTLLVQDNGQGMDAAKLSDPWSIGLVGMRERARLLGGQCHIVSGAPEGTRVEVCLPLGGAAPIPGQTTQTDYDENPSSR